MDHPYWKWLWRIGILVSVVSGLVSIVGNTQHVSLPILYTLVAFGLVLGIVGLLLDFKPWKWFSRRTRFPFENSPPFQELLVAWKCHKTHGEQHYPREALSRYRDWPVIQDSACRLFKHPMFTANTWLMMENWLVANRFNRDGEKLRRASIAEIAEILQKAAK